MKIIRVESCATCPYLYPVRNEAVFCSAMAMQELVNTDDALSTPPDWCPLEDCEHGTDRT